MKIKTIILAVIAMSFVVCCGCDKTLNKEEIKKYETSGSLYTLWYEGSDDKYHYFSHLCKVKQRFKVKRDEISISSHRKHGSLKEYILVDYIEDNKCILLCDVPLLKTKKNPNEEDTSNSDSAVAKPE